MIRHPLAIVFVLLLIEGAVLFLAGHERFKKFFHVIPFVFWIYFTPMLAATFGLIDAQSAVYDGVTKYFLPASLFLLLLPADIKAVFRLGPIALGMMLAGSFGVILGTGLAFFIFKDIVGVEFWSGFGALAGSWTGGSANMIAVKEAMATPDKVFLPMVVVDTIVPYAWMAILVGAVGLRPLFNRWTRCDARVMEDLKGRMATAGGKQDRPLAVFDVIFLISLAVFLGVAARYFAGFFPAWKDVLTGNSWTIIIISSLGVGCSFTRLRKLEEIGAGKVGYFLLYFVLTAIGAKANLSQLGSAVVLIAAGFFILIVHGVVLVAAARLFRAPLFLVSVASQANVGGLASAPIVAEIYQPGFAPVGLLMAVFGNIVGTYLGILTAQLCRVCASL